MSSLTKKKQYESVKAKMRAAIKNNNADLEGARDLMFNAIKKGVIDLKNAGKLIDKINIKRTWYGVDTNIHGYKYNQTKDGSAVAKFLQILKPVACQKDMEKLKQDARNYYDDSDYLKAASVVINLRKIEQAIRIKADKLVKGSSQQNRLKTAADMIQVEYSKLTRESRSATDIKNAVDNSFVDINKSNIAAIIDMQRGRVKSKITSTRDTINKAVANLNLVVYQNEGHLISMASISDDYEKSKTHAVATSGSFKAAMVLFRSATDSHSDFDAGVGASESEGAGSFSTSISMMNKPSLLSRSEGSNLSL